MPFVISRSAVRPFANDAWLTTSTNALDCQQNCRDFFGEEFPRKCSSQQRLISACSSTGASAIDIGLLTNSKYDTAPDRNPGCYSYFPGSS